MEYPTILRRYLSTAIDSLFVIATVIAISYLFQNYNSVSTMVRVAIILFMFFVYEPFCTSQLCTIGQKITGIRVRQKGTDERISLVRAYVRISGKALLGFISFFTIPFTEHKRAIHDLMAGSVVLLKTE